MTRRHRMRVRLVLVCSSILLAATPAGGLLGTVPPTAHADALCDQLRAQYGPSWPCISVPT